MTILDTQVDFSLKLPHSRRGIKILSAAWIVFGCWERCLDIYNIPHGYTAGRVCSGIMSGIDHKICSASLWRILAYLHKYSSQL